jgi:hypothetical protein
LLIVTLQNVITLMNPEDMIKRGIMFQSDSVIHEIE